MPITWCCATVFAEYCTHGQDSTVCIQKSILTKCVKKQGKAKTNESKVKVWFSPSLLWFCLFLLQVIRSLKLIYQISSLSSKRDRSLVQDTRELGADGFFTPSAQRLSNSVGHSQSLFSISSVGRVCIFLPVFCYPIALCDRWAMSGWAMSDP